MQAFAYSELIFCASLLVNTSFTSRCFDCAAHNPRRTFCLRNRHVCSSPHYFPASPSIRCRNLCVPPPPPVDGRWHCSVWGPWFCLTGIVTAERAEELAGYWAHGCGGCEGCRAEKRTKRGKRLLFDSFIVSLDITCSSSLEIRLQGVGALSVACRARSCLKDRGHGQRDVGELKIIKRRLILGYSGDRFETAIQSSLLHIRTNLYFSRARELIFCSDEYSFEPNLKNTPILSVCFSRSTIYSRVMCCRVSSPRGFTNMDGIGVCVCPCDSALVYGRNGVFAQTSLLLWL